MVIHMTHANPPDAKLYEILDKAKTIAVVGASSNPDRSSHGVMHQLLEAGYDVYPVNPNEAEVLGRKAYASLSDIPVPVDIVNVFRQASATPPIAAEAVAIGAKTLWLQLGIVNETAAATATIGGLNVVMDNCIAVTRRLLAVPRRG